MQPILGAGVDRRAFLSRSIAVAAGLCGLDAGAREPLKRSPGGPLRLSLAAYSLRSLLDLKKPTMTLEEFISQSAAWGFDGVELTEYFFPKPITAESIRALKLRAALCGVDITGTPVGNNFALPPGAEREKQLDAVRAWIRVSADLGSPAIRVFAGSAPAGVEEAKARAWVVECLETLCADTERHGVFLAVENHGGVVSTADGLLEIVRAVKCPWVAVNLDTGNFHTPDPYGDLERCAPYAITCQLKLDMSPAGQKKGPADIARIVAILRKTEYRGYVTLEYESDGDPVTEIPRRLKELRSLLRE